MNDFVLMINKWVANNGWSDVVDAEWILECAKEIALLAESTKINSRLPEQIHRTCSKHLSIKLHALCVRGDDMAKNTAYTALYRFMARMAIPRLHDEALAQETAQRALEAIYAKITTVRDPRAFLGFCQVVMMRIIFAASRQRNSADQDVTCLDEMLETNAGETNPPGYLANAETTDGSLREADRQAVRSSFWEKLLNTPALSALDKKLLIWVYREDISRQEICRREKLSRSALDVKLHRARNKITQSPQLYSALIDLAEVL